MRISGGSETKKHQIIILMAIAIGAVVAFQASRMSLRTFTPSERQAIEIGRLFLDAVGYRTGRVLSLQLEEKKPNFYWDVVVESDVEWDRLDVWDKMLKYNRPELRETRPCWIVRFEQARRPGHFYEVWLDASEHILVGGSSCK